MLKRRFFLWDESAVAAMTSFPLQRFESAPIAYVQMQSATGEHFVAAVEADGTLSCTSPSIHTIHSVTHLLSEDDQDDAVVWGVAAKGPELCVVVWDAATPRYVVHFLKAQRMQLTRLGAATLAPPDPCCFLCGLTHLGNALCAVWSDGGVQCYAPSRDVQSGVLLTRTYKLGGMDFPAMRRTAGTEDLKKLSGSLAVCSNLNVEGVVCIVGPELTTLKLKYVVLDLASGIVQESGRVEKNVTGDGPIKIVADAQEKGIFQLFVGDEAYGLVRVSMKASTLAARIGAQRRKRKLEDDVTSDRKMQMPCVMVHPPRWLPITSGTDSAGPKAAFVPGKILKKLSRLEDGQNGCIDTLYAFDQRCRACLKKMGTLLDSGKPDASLANEAVDLVKDWRASGGELEVDLAGAVAEYVGACCRDWERLRSLLELSPPKSLALCPRLPEVLLRAGQFDLFARLLADVGDVDAEHLAALIQTLLSPEFNAATATFQANALHRIQSSLQQTFHELQTAKREDIPIQSYQKWKLCSEAALGFGMTGLLLHSVMSHFSSGPELLPVLNSLDRDQSRYLLQYLHSTFCVQSAQLTEVDRICHIEAVRQIPSLRSVAGWLSVLLSLYFDTFVQDPSLHEILRHLQRELQSLRTEGKDLATLRSYCRVLQQQKLQKPASKSDYKIHILDLSFSHL